jgi:hypothetical protein
MTKGQNKARKTRQIRRIMKNLDWVNVPASITVHSRYGGGLSRSDARGAIRNAQINASDD